MYTREDLNDILRTVPAPSLVGVGDNVLDCYLHEDLAYPGGNALNVAVYSRLFFGGDAAFIGIMGDDRFAAHLQLVLDDLQVDRSRTRIASGANGMAFVALDDEGDRIFVGSNRGGVQHGLRLRVTDEDHDYIAGYARLHTSVYSAIDEELPGIARRGTCISYDYSEKATEGAIRATAPHVEVGFFSGGALDDDAVDELGESALRSGMGTAVVTRGSRGARAFQADRRLDVGVRDIVAIDALGAGDGFITGFLAAHAADRSLEECLDVASAAGALACMMRGAFGHPVIAGDDARSQMVRRISMAPSS